MYTTAVPIGSRLRPWNDANSLTYIYYIYIYIHIYCIYIYIYIYKYTTGIIMYIKSCEKQSGMALQSLEIKLFF